jgi:hypothetical protein
MKSSLNDKSSATDSVLGVGVISTAQVALSKQVTRVCALVRACGASIFGRDTANLLLTPVLVFVLVLEGCAWGPSRQDSVSADGVIRGSQGACLKKAGGRTYVNTCAYDLDLGACRAYSLMGNVACGAEGSVKSGAQLTLNDRADYGVACRAGSLVQEGDKFGRNQIYCGDGGGGSDFARRETPEQIEAKRATIASITQGLYGIAAAKQGVPYVPPMQASTTQFPAARSADAAQPQPIVLRQQSPQIYNGRQDAADSAPASPAACPARGNTIASLRAHGRCACTAPLIYKDQPRGFSCGNSAGILSFGCQLRTDGSVACIQN